MLQDSSPLPLAQMRVLDCCDRIGQDCGRFLADLGAEVILLEPEDGMTSRQRPPLHKGESLYFATHNANKKSVVVDLQSEQGREQFLALVKSADLLIDGGELTGWGISHEEIRTANPQLLLLSITDFGLKGLYKNFIATEAVQACQESGVPAGNMLRLSEFLSNPHLRERGFFRTLNQPTVGRPLDTENAPVGSSELLPDPDINRAPARAEHTRELAKVYLGYSDFEVDTLIEAGVLEIGKPGGCWCHEIENKNGLSLSHDKGIFKI